MINKIIKGFGVEKMDIFAICDSYTVTHTYSLLGMVYKESYTIYGGDCIDEESEPDLFFE